MPPVEEGDRQLEQLRDQPLHQVELEQTHQALHRQLTDVHAERAGDEDAEQQSDDHPQSGHLADGSRQSRRKPGRLREHARQEVANQKNGGDSRADAAQGGDGERQEAAASEPRRSAVRTTRRSAWPTEERQAAVSWIRGHGRRRRQISYRPLMNFPFLHTRAVGAMDGARRGRYHDRVPANPPCSHRTTLMASRLRSR